FASYPSLLHATVSRLLGASLPPVVVVHSSSDEDRRVPSLLGELSVQRFEIAAPSPLQMVAKLLATQRFVEEGIELAVIVDPRAAFVSPRVLEVELEAHRVRHAEVALC